MGQVGVFWEMVTLELGWKGWRGGVEKARMAGCSDLKRKVGVCERWGELEAGLGLGCVQGGTGCEHMTLSSREREAGIGREE